jgi:hypothetical protein
LLRTSLTYFSNDLWQMVEAPICNKVALRGNTY